MSTKAIREALDLLCRTRVDDLGRASAALAEVEAIEKAAKDISALTPGEVVDEFKKNPSNPLVLKWLDAATTFAVIAGRMKTL